MSYDRIPRRVLLLGLLALGGCGFTPIYGTDSTYRDSITFTADASVAGFLLQERLEDRLGRSAAPRYRMTVAISNSERAASINQDGETDRLNVVGAANWALTDISSGQVIEAGNVQAFTGYSASGSTVATQSARDDAVARLSVILADMIISRILTLTPKQPV